MPFLIAAVVLVGALCALDLILTLGVVKRLREHTALLSQASAGGTAATGLDFGDEVGRFAAADVDGRALTSDKLGGHTFVAVVSPSCEQCRDKLPELVGRAQAVPGGRDSTIAVVVGERAEADDFVAALSPVARVVVESPGGPVGAAFRAFAYPTMLWVARDDSGRLVKTDHPVMSPA